MSYLKNTTAADLRPGDMVNGHMDGWLYVCEVRKEWPGWLVIFKCPARGDRIIEKSYWRDEPIDFFRK